MRVEGGTLANQGAFAFCSFVNSTLFWLRSFAMSFLAGAMVDVLFDRLTNVARPGGWEAEMATG